MGKIKVVQYGLGPIGQATAKLALDKESLELVGAIDIDPEKVGKDLGEILGRGKLGVTVSDDAGAVLKQAAGGCALHTTSSFMKAVADQLELCIANGVHVSSSTEELLLPDLRSPEIFDDLDAKAKASGVTVLGTGVNPGFVMDALPVFVTGVCDSVESIYVERFVDAATRRQPLQAKVGAGITVEKFDELKAADQIGHRGLRESIEFIARGLGWKLDEVTEKLEPMVADKPYKTDYFEIEPGQVTGIWNTGRGVAGGKELISLELRMYVGCDDPHDEVRVTGSPPMIVRVVGGTAGDFATAAAVVNAVPRVVAGEAGLKTMMDLAMPRIVN